MAGRPNNLINSYWLTRRQADIELLAQKLRVAAPDGVAADVTPVAFRMSAALVASLDETAVRFGTTRSALVELFLRNALAGVTEQEKTDDRQRDLFA
jgi:hypothetical protein